MPSCCLMVVAAPAILFRINWRYINQVFHIHRIFNSHNSHIWPETNRHAASVHCHQQCFVVKVGAGIVRDSLVGPSLLPHGSVYSFTVYFWRENYQKCWRRSCWHSGETCGFSTTGLWLTLHIRSKNISFPLTTIAE